MADPVNDFDIRAGLPLNEPELRGEILVFEQLFERSAALTAQNADCAAVSAEFSNHLAHVDALAAGIRAHFRDAVDRVKRHTRNFYRFIQCGVECYRIDHGMTPFRYLKLLKRKL